MIAKTIFLGVFFSAAIYDLRFKKIPNIMLIALFALWAFFAVFQFVPGEEIDVISHLTGAAAGLAVFLSAWYLSKGRMGFGDVKLGMVMGLYMGTDTLLYAILFGGVIMAAVFLIRGRSGTLPMAPFLFIGSCIALLCGSFLP